MILTLLNILLLLFTVTSLSTQNNNQEFNHPHGLSNYMEELLERNHAWAYKTQHVYPEFLPSLDLKQTPKVLWIGCSDSRVPESKIFEVEPGEFFVHRNIGNVVRSDDLNLNAVVEYAVKVLKVEDIIICGHYHCGGVQAAMSKLTKDQVHDWIKPVKKIYDEETPDQAWRAMVRYNVHHSAKVMSQLPSVKFALSQPNSNLTIHPWVYDIKTGLVDIMEDHGKELGGGSWLTPKKKLPSINTTK